MNKGTKKRDQYKNHNSVAHIILKFFVMGAQKENGEGIEK